MIKIIRTLDKSIAHLDLFRSKRNRWKIEVQARCISSLKRNGTKWKTDEEKRILWCECLKYKKRERERTRARGKHLDCVSEFLLFLFFTGYREDKCAHFHSAFLTIKFVSISLWIQIEHEELRAEMKRIYRPRNESFIVKSIDQIVAIQHL